MDRDDIYEKQIVERYVLGRLNDKETEEFEAYCLEHPECLEEINDTEGFLLGLKAYAAEETIHRAAGPRPSVITRLNDWLDRFIPQPALAFTLLALVAPVGLIVGGNDGAGPAIDDGQIGMTSEILDLGGGTRSAFGMAPENSAAANAETASLLVFRVFLPIDAEQGQRFAFYLYDREKNLLWQSEKISASSTGDHLAIAFAKDFLSVGTYSYEVKTHAQAYGKLEKILDGTFEMR